MRERREKIASIILSGLASQIDCSKAKEYKGITKNVSDEDYVDKAIELADILINKLDTKNDDGSLTSF
jgi:hypothetical protein